MTIEQKENNPLLNKDGQLMVMAACRYCLGRQTYMVKSCQDWVRKWKHLFTADTKRTMVRDLLQELMLSGSGASLDRESWTQLAQELWDEMDAEAQTVCRQALGHWGKPWPLKSKILSGCGGGGGEDEGCNTLR